MTPLGPGIRRERGAPGDDGSHGDTTVSSSASVQTMNLRIAHSFRGEGAPHTPALTGSRINKP